MQKLCQLMSVLRPVGNPRLPRRWFTNAVPSFGICHIKGRTPSANRSLQIVLHTHTPTLRGDAFQWSLFTAFAPATKLTISKGRKNNE